MYSPILKAFGVLALFILLLAPLSAFAATLFLTPSGGSHYSGENFNVGVLISSDTSVNAFFGVISFPTNTLEIINVSKSNSIIDLWTQNPSFSNTGNFGNVNFEGVVLNPGFIGSNGRILTLTFRVKKGGSANLAFSKYSVLKNDGLGTNAAVTAQGAHFIFSPPRPDTREDETLPSVRNTIVVEKVYIPTGITGVWNFLPEWIKISVLSLVGLTTALLSLLIISFGVITLIWLWSHLRERKGEIIGWFGVLQILVKIFFRAIPAWFGLVKKEVREDVKYSIGQLSENVKEARDHLSLSKVLDNYWVSIKRIVKRFFTKNNETTKETTDEGIETVEEDKDVLI